MISTFLFFFLSAYTLSRPIDLAVQPRFNGIFALSRCI